MSSVPTSMASRRGRPGLFGLATAAAVIVASLAGTTGASAAPSVTASVAAPASTGSWASSGPFADLDDRGQLARKVSKTDFRTERANRELVTDYLERLLIDLDPTALDDYVDPGYIQHNPNLPNGTEVLREIIANPPPGFGFELGTVIADDDLVFAHGRYTGLAEGPLIGVDIFRVKDGVIVEHWDVLQPEVPVDQTASGNPMFPIEPSPLAKRFNRSPISELIEEYNEQRVTEALDRVFNDLDETAIDTYWDENYIQHNPSFPNGTGFLRDFVNNAPEGFSYEPGTIVADGDLVFAHIRYTGFLPEPVIVVDIFRMEKGLIVEHWDVIQTEVPADQTVSGNPMFPISPAS